MIRFYEELISTQDEMKALAGSGELAHLDAVHAGIQTGGRGRQGREWIAPRGNLSASIFLCDFKIPLTWIPLWVGLALLRSLENRFPELDPRSVRGVRLKWPNDLVLGSGEKLGGILCEKIDSGVVAGVGLNLETAPALADRRSASLVGCLEPSRVRDSFPKPGLILEDLLSELRREPGVDEIRSGFMQVALHQPGQEIFWKNPQTGLRNAGFVQGLGPHGELRITLPDGIEQGLFSEDVEAIRGNSGRDSSEE